MVSANEGKGGGGERGELDARAKRGAFPSPVRAPLASCVGQVPPYSHPFVCHVGLRPTYSNGLHPEDLSHIFQTRRGVDMKGEIVVLAF